MHLKEIAPKFLTFMRLTNESIMKFRTNQINWFDIPSAATNAILWNAQKIWEKFKYLFSRELRKVSEAHCSNQISGRISMLPLNKFHKSTLTRLKPNSGWLFIILCILNRWFVHTGVLGLLSIPFLFRRNPNFKSSENELVFWWTLHRAGMALGGEECSRVKERRVALGGFARCLNQISPFFSTCFVLFYLETERAKTRFTDLHSTFDSV